MATHSLAAVAFGCSPREASKGGMKVTSTVVFFRPLHTPISLPRSALSGALPRSALSDARPSDAHSDEQCRGFNPNLNSDSAMHVRYVVSQSANHLGSCKKSQPTKKVALSSTINDRQENPHSRSGLFFLSHALSLARTRSLWLWLHFTFYFLLFTFSFWSRFTFYFLLFTFYFLLFTFYFFALVSFYFFTFSLWSRFTFLLFTFYFFALVSLSPSLWRIFLSFCVFEWRTHVLCRSQKDSGTVGMSFTFGLAPQTHPRDRLNKKRTASTDRQAKRLGRLNRDKHKHRKGVCHSKSVREQTARRMSCTSQRQHGADKGQYENGKRWLFLQTFICHDDLF